MSRPDFAALRSQLLRGGIAPRHVERTVTELRDHFDDLLEAASNKGVDRDSAEQLASEELGNLDSIALAMCASGDFRSWASQYPKLALVVYPLACVAVLPAVPVIAGVANASQLMRWLACAAASALVTATILLVLQLSITLS